jgi:phage gp46-like protein
MELAFYSDLKSAVIASLLSKKRFEKQQGYWTEPLTGLNFGSYLWQLERAPLTEVTLERAKNYGLDALRWLTDRGVGVFVDAKKSGHNRLVLSISIDQKEEFELAL